MPKFILAAAISLFLPQAVKAATLLWDQDQADLNNTSAGSAGTGGTGFWTTSNPQWYDGANYPTGGSDHRWRASVQHVGIRH
jgi:hypothetical protein